MLDRFAKTLAKAPKHPLTFAGQFNVLKPFGKHAAAGAIAILKDPTKRRQFRNWAGDAIADIGDKSVMAELKAIADDFLYEDDDQESAAFALAALGDTSETDKRIATLEDERRRTGSLSVALRIAHVHYRARQYVKAVKMYRNILASFEKGLAAKKDEFEPEQLAQYRSWQAGWYYSLACNQSLEGKPAEAMKSLDECLRHGRDGRHLEMLMRDGDLMKVRHHATFAKWYEKARAAVKTKSPAKKPDAPGKAAPPAERPAGEKKKAGSVGG